MDALERRRSKRVVVPREQAAVIHDQHREIPAKLVDLSRTGALVRLFTLSLMVEDSLSDCIELSMHDDRSVLYVKARIVRRGPQFIAVEFIDERTDVHKRIDEKLRNMGEELSARKAKGAEA